MDPSPRQRRIRTEAVILLIVVVIFSLGNLKIEKNAAKLVGLSRLSFLASDENTKAVINIHPTTHDNNPTSILRGEVPWPDPSTDLLQFRPGTLNMSRVEAFRHCHVDPDIYERHTRRNYKAPDWIVSVSDEHKLMYFFMPKSASSTSRYIMREIFHAKERRRKPTDPRYEKFTFVREPLSRFFSSYSESYLRTTPWKLKRQGLNYTHPFPYLHEGLHNNSELRDIFCPPETRINFTEWECQFQQTKENGTLAARLVRFVQEYDGRSPFDVHLHLQTALLMMPAEPTTNEDTSATSTPPPPRRRRQLEPVPVDWLYEADRARDEWERIATRKGVPFPIEGEFKARSIPRRFDMKFIPNSTKRRICELSALDYCCLNFVLPPECVDSNAYCALERSSNSGGGGGSSGRVRIRPWSYPASGKQP